MILARNRQVSYRYHILEQFQAGLVLEGWEVKSIKAGRGQIEQAYALISNDQCSLINMHVTPLEHVSAHQQVETTRSKRVLLHRAQINKLIGKTKEEGISLVPMNIHEHRGKIKVQLALVRGKKLHDKRESLKQKQWNREKQRVLKESK